MALVGGRAAVHAIKSPWYEIAGGVIVAYFVWETFLKLSSDKAVTKFGFGHFQSFLLSALVVLAAPFWLFGALSERDELGWQALLSVSISLLGSVMLFAAIKDYRKWKTEDNEMTRSRDDN